MPRYGRYLRLEKNIAASDTGGILERWRYGRRLLSDGTATTPNGNLRNGVRERLIAEAAAGGYKISKSEIAYRLQCGRAYETEAQLSTAREQYSDWTSLREAGFPPVEMPADAEPYDPREADEKWRDFRSEQERRKAENPEQLAFELPSMFSHDTYGPRTHLSDLIAACDESERMTANFVKRDNERRAYVDELLDAAGGNDQMTWIEAEARRLGLDAIGVSDWDSFAEIMDDFFGPRPDGE